MRTFEIQDQPIQIKNEKKAKNNEPKQKVKIGVNEWNQKRSIGI